MHNDTLVTIDAMYIVYHSLFRTIRIWQTKNKTEAIPYMTQRTDGTYSNLLDSDTFKAGLTMSLIHTCTRINDIITEAFPQYDGLEPSTFATQLFVIDDKTGNGFRRALYPEYKMSRLVARAQQPFDLGVIRQYIVGYLFDELDIWNRLGYTKVFVDNAEADDVIYATMTKFDDMFPNKLIISSDHDMLQIPNVLQYNLEGKLVTRKNSKDQPMTTKDFLLLKVIMGDGSDNIPGIAPRCGRVKAEKFINDPAMFKRFLADNPDALAKFKLNLSIVDSSKMPTELSSKITETVHSIFNDLDSTPSNSLDSMEFNILNAIL